MSNPNHSVAEDRDNEPNSAPKLLLKGPEGDGAGASLDKLRGEWRRLYRCEPPRISRDLLLRGIAYRRQELKHGGLGKTIRRKLKTLAKMFRTTGRVGPDPALALKPGAERIRDKIAASKKKGMWMGGLPPLGYDVRDRKLVVNQEEAQTLLHTFRRYVELRSVRALKVELDAAGIRSKRRTFADGTVYGGHKLSRGALYLMLQNRIYRGDITHKGDPYPGEHKAIVDKALWDKVQAVLAENRVNRTTGIDAKYPSLLAGLVFDDSGERLTPTHAVKKGTRYRYYVSRSLITGTAKDHSQGRRIPAGNLEGLVIGRLRAFLADEEAMLSAISDAEENGADQKRLIARGGQISEELPTLTPDAIRSILLTLISRIDIKAEHVEIRLYRHRLHDLLQARSLESSLADRAPASHLGDSLKLEVKARLQRVGREMKLVVHNAEQRAAADPGLLRIVAPAHDFQERLIQDPDLTVPAIASQGRLTIGYLSRLLRLPSLAPDIVTAIINGKHPPELRAKRLMRLALKLPTDWAEQRKLLGLQGA